MTKYDAIGEVIPVHYQIHISNETLCFIHSATACHSYNIINVNNQQIKIATIETMMAFYLAFYYSDKPYHEKDRILCMAEYLFNVINENRLNQRGILKRFSLDCYGKQKTMQDIREEKIKKFNELKGDRKSRDYNMWFLKYALQDSDKIEKIIKTENEKSKNLTAKKKRKKKLKKAVDGLMGLFK